MSLIERLKGRRDIAGMTVVVTGASSGIGRAAARALAARGAEVLLLARRQEALDEVVGEIEQDGGRARAYAVDLSDLDAVDRVSADILHNHPRIDVLVNNAGRSIRRPLVESLDRFHDFQRTMQINYFAAVKLTLNLLPAMLERGSGHVINILTWGTMLPAPRFAAYVASKCALDGFSRAMDAELQPHGIATTTVHYPIVRTPMIEPTKLYKKLPGMSPEEAAAWIVKAVRSRPARVAPGFAVLSGVNAHLFPGFSNAVAQKLGI